MVLLKTTVICCLVAITLAADEHRPKKIKDDTRGKRNLGYSISHHYSNIRPVTSDRRISNVPSYYPQFFPGPTRSHYHSKGTKPHSLPIPPYAVQMEPLVHYSQRDPLYDTNNALSLPTDGHNDIGHPLDLQTDNNHVDEHHSYGPPHKIIERPIYIKEPEPIIEIIIKESNVSLPALPTPPPQKKKKEQVQVFYVKYKKNPHGHGKDSVIYDKPVPAISPPIHDEEEEDHGYEHQEPVTLPPPPPSTTLRTIIKPDSETYHSPSGVKVTFGKEGWEHDKRSNKPSDFDQSSKAQPAHKARQLSFSSELERRSPIINPLNGNNYQFPSYNSDLRQPQSYRPFSHQPSQNPQSFSSQYDPNKPPVYSTIPKSIYESNPVPKPHFNPAPPQFQNSFKSSGHHHFSSPAQFSSGPPSSQPSFASFKTQYPTVQPQRQPVAYKPFDFKTSQSSGNHPFRPETHFQNSHQQLPTTEEPQVFSQKNVQQLPYRQNAEFSKQPSFANHFGGQAQNTFEQLPSFNNHHFSSAQEVHIPKSPLPAKYQHTFDQKQPTQQFHSNTIQSQSFPPHHQQQQQQQSPQIPNTHQPSHDNNFHINNFQHIQNVIPPGGQLIQAVPKFEQHIEVQEPNYQHQPSVQQEQALFSQQQNIQEQTIFHQQPSTHQEQESFHQSTERIQYNPSSSTTKHFAEDYQNIQQQFQQAAQLQESIRQSSRNNPVQLPAPQFQLPVHQNRQFEQQYVKQQNTQHTTPSPSTPNFGNYNPQQQRTTFQYSTHYTTPRPYISSTTPTTKTNPSTTQKVTTTTKDSKILEAQLPDEVPEDLRQQLLSSGILNNAQISILDYDKVGDIPLSALPPDQLANFYAGGGAQQLAAAGSAPIPQFLTKNGEKVDKSFEIDSDEDQDSEASEVFEQRVRSKSQVQMKVVHYNPETTKGQDIQDSYIQSNAKQLEPVNLNDKSFTRYLPLKVSGAQFPIPDVEELRGKKINSVVVLAPVKQDFSSRRTRDLQSQIKELEQLKRETLKELIKNPTEDNYKKFLEAEKKMKSDDQAVVLLVASDGSSKNKEIFMYDLATKTVSKLSGDLSSAFVEAAEANASDRIDEEIDLENVNGQSSSIFETRIPFIRGTYEN